ncbi:transcription antitermination protein NusG [Streptobacillus moniliformis]|nr:transcription antitermination protein NusG [Streptobacillus moniliformis]
MIIENKEYVKKWYIIHTYSGYEKKVKTDLGKKNYVRRFK